MAINVVNNGVIPHSVDLYKGMKMPQQQSFLGKALCSSIEPAHNVKYAGVDLTRGLIKQAKKKIHVPTRTEKIQKKIKTASTTFSAVTGAMSGVQALNKQFGVQIPHIFNKIAVGLKGAFVPFTFVSSALSIVNSTLSIASSAMTLKKQVKELKHIKEKKKLWEKQEFTAEFATSKMEKIQKKMASTQEEGLKIKEKVDQLSKDVKEAYKKFLDTKITRLETLKNAEKENPIKRAFIHIREFFKHFKEEKQRKDLKKLVAMHHVVSKELEDKINSYEALEKNKENWKIIRTKINNNDLTAEDKEALETMRSEKLAKWDIKKVNMSYNQSKEGLDIALNVIFIIAAIAMIALAATGVGTPAAMLALSIISSATAVGSIGVTLFRKFKKDKPHHSVLVPQLT